MIMGKVPQTISATVNKIPDGVAGIKVTLDVMAELARRGRESWKIRRLAENIVSNVTQKDYMAEARAIQEWVRDQIRYTRDVRDVETLAPAEYTVARGLGDCDDKALLVATLLEAVGHRTRFVAVGRNFGNYEHVLAEVYINGSWVPVETTENVALGWYPPNARYRMVVNVK